MSFVFLDVADRCCLLVVFFFKQKTAYEIKECDWSSDVCSSDLLAAAMLDEIFAAAGIVGDQRVLVA